jgi:hypothetical protein
MTRNFRQNCWHPSWDSNQAPPEYD